MRMTLTGSLSQPCHPTLTLLIPHVTQGASHNARRTAESHLPALVHVFTHPMCAHTHTPLCLQIRVTGRHTHLKARRAVCSSSVAMARLQCSSKEIRGPDPFRVLMERCGIKGDQRPNRLIEERYLAWATPRDTLYCWHFAWEIQSETGHLNPSYLGFVFNRSEAGPSGLGKRHSEWQDACFYVCSQAHVGWEQWEWYFLFIYFLFFASECRSSGEVIVNCASSCDTSDQKHYQVVRLPRLLSLKLTQCRFSFIHVLLIIFALVFFPLLHVCLSE